MAVPTAPDLELLLTTPFRLRVLATGDFEAEEVTDLTFQVSTVSDFASTLDSSEVQVQDYEYAIAEGNRDDTLYVRAKATNDEGDSSWSDTLTVAAIAKPSAPTLVERGSAPQRIAVGATGLDASTFRVTFEFSMESDFSIVDWETFIEAGPALAEYRVPAADRRTTHYVRAKVGYIADVDTDTGEELFWESDWSDTVEVAGAGKIDSRDINSRSVNAFGYVTGGTAHSAGGTTFQLATSAAVEAKTYLVNIVLAIEFNAQTDLKWQMTLPTGGFDAALYTVSYATLAASGSTYSGAAGTRTVYYGNTTPGTVTQLLSGSTTTSLGMAHIEIRGLMTFVTAGTFGVSFAPNTTPTAAVPTVKSETFDIEEMFNPV